MKPERICAVFFSPTGTTDKTVNTLADTLASRLALPLERICFTKPAERRKEYRFTEADLVIVGTPTYAGRVPNKILPDFQTHLHGNGALAVPVVLFGNRSYDNALAELCKILQGVDFYTVAAAAFVGRHAFTDRLGENRPDWDDRREMASFAEKIADKVNSLTDIPEPIQVPGDPEGPYYVPRDTTGGRADFLKAKPKTSLGRCTNCGACARLCPMGAINPERVDEVPGTCIKCQSCVRKCTKHAKYFDDPAFLSHVAMLEETFAEPKKNAIFL